MLPDLADGQGARAFKGAAPFNHEKQRETVMQIKSSNKLLNSLTKAELETLKSNYEINDALIQKGLNPKAFDVVVKFFNPTGMGTWYLTELSPDGIAFGLCHLVDVELGYVSLEELASLRLRGGLGIEKDRYFSGKDLSLSSLSKKLREENK